MALTIFLFKVSNIDLARLKPKTDILGEEEEQALTVSEEHTNLLTAKATFRGISLWSNNVPIHDGVASFLARGNKPKKLHFNLATMLLPEDKLRIEFYTVTQKKSRKKLFGIFELMLESLLEEKSIDLPEENLSDLNYYLIKSTLHIKLFYTSPDLEREKAALGATGEEVEVIDWNSTFDDGGGHGGHRYRHVESKHAGRFAKLRKKLVGRQDNADTDTDSDTDYDGHEDDGTMAGMTQDEKLLAQQKTLEILEKTLGRYEGDLYQRKEWQILVHVIQGKDLVGLDINPYVCVQIGNQKRFTSVHRSSNSPLFGQFFTFDFNLPVTQMMEKVLFFKVHDEMRIVSTFTHTKPIGIFRVDIATVYNENEHVFERKWAQLVNPDQMKASAGYLLLSVAVTERGVPSKNILGEISDDEEREIKPSKIFIPAAMPRALIPTQLKITFHRAEELPEMMTDFIANVSKFFRPDKWQPVDSFVEVSYNAIQAETAHVNGTSPAWREAFYLIGRFPPLARSIKVALKDHAAVQKNRTIASFMIDLLAISEANPQAAVRFMPTFGPTWIFLYGSPREYTINTDHDGLAEGVGEAVCYKGRLLMEIECHPITGEHASTSNVQKEKKVLIPDPVKFPLEREFMLFGCIYDVTMIDKEFGNTTICFELSIGSSGYLKPDELMAHKSSSSITQPYPRVKITNDERHFRLPIDKQKPIVFTKYSFHDYSYRMVVSNRLKRAANHMYKLIREFEMNLNSKAPDNVLLALYRKMEEYVHELPCGCSERDTKEGSVGVSGVSGVVHPSLVELLNAPKFSCRMNTLDEKRHKKLVHNLEALRGWISKDIKFDEDKRYEIVKQLQKIARSLKLMATDPQPSLPDVFLWMVCDAKRVAYARIPPEDLLYSICEGEKGLHHGIVQTLFLQTPHTSDKELKASTNAKVQIYLWLGTIEQEPFIFKRMPTGFEPLQLPLTIHHNFIHYSESSRYELRCYICKARSLIASDETGLSDPFLSITAGHETQMTPILKESLCPQWNMTLVFENLEYFGPPETAEEIIGNVVVECYDYDDDGDGSDLIGRFSTTAELNLLQQERSAHETPLRWYEFKLGDKRAGELLAAFELIALDSELDPMYDLDEVEVTPEVFPSDKFETKLMNNKIYHIPDSIMPESKLYEIEVLFWGLRECRPIKLQPIQQAEVHVDCATARITRTITNVQKYPNFDSHIDDLGKYKLRVKLPKDNNFWPHLSIRCIQKDRLLGLSEPVGNLVVTDLEDYLDKPSVFLTSKNEGTDVEKKESSKPVTYNFNRVRQSVIDAYEASIGDKDPTAKKKLAALDKAVNQQKSVNDSEKHLVLNDQLAEEKLSDDDDDDDNLEDQIEKQLADADPLTELPLEKRVLTVEQKKSLMETEKTATWWSKYYAAKAKLKLAEKPKVDLDEQFIDAQEVYGDFYENDKIAVLKRHQVFWNKTKQFLGHAKKTRQALTNRAALALEDIGDITKPKSAVDESIELIEQDRLKDLSLLQSFIFIDKELEKVEEYEGFNDILDIFPLYKGKGTSRKDENIDEKRVFAKFKGKIRIHEVPEEDTPAQTSIEVSNIPRKSMNPAVLTGQFEPAGKQPHVPGTGINEHMFQFDFNRNRVTLKCRLYIIKALLFRAWDRSGKADPYIKVYLNNKLIIDDEKSKILNTLEPVFGKAHEFEVTIPQQSLLRIQVWDWDLTNVNDKIAETSIDIENRWLSCHRGTCGLSKRYDSAGYNCWRDTKKPDIILNDLCQQSNMKLPLYTADCSALAIDDERFNCDPECVLFANTKKMDLGYRKAHHESPKEYIKQNTALGALHEWGKRINPRGTLVEEHTECRSLIDPEFPEVEQGKLEMWLDIFPMSRPPSSAPIDITPPKSVAYQLRLTIWNTSDVQLDDENFLTGEKSSDIYVKGWIKGENEDLQETDVHYRSLTGDGNFNWRFIYDFDYIDIEEKIVFEKKDSILQIGTTKKKIPPRVVLRVYDADLISSDDFLGECILDLTHIPIGAKSAHKCKADMLTSEKQKNINLFKKKRCVGWWPMLAQKKPDGILGEETLIGGKVEAEFSLVLAEDAAKSPVGRGHEGPSELPLPDRPKTSFLWFTSPWKTFKYVIWRNFKWIIIFGILILIFVICLLLALWTVPGEIVHQISNKIFGTNGAGR